MSGQFPKWTVVGTLVILGAVLAVRQFAPPTTPPPGSKPAGLGDTGTHLFSGRPLFPIGIDRVHHTDADYELLARNGFNTVQGHCDLVELRRYPLPDVPDFWKLARREMEPWQNLTVIVQSGWARDLTTRPTCMQARSLIYLALIGGAKGIFWHSRGGDDGWDLATAPLRTQMKESNAEISPLAVPVVLGDFVPGIRCGGDAVRFAAWRHQDQIQSLVTNPDAQKVDALLTLPDAIASATARLAGTGSATLVLGL